jgi:hypothetical protein
MLAKLKAKAGSDRIPVTVGSFADFSLQTRVRLVFVVFNTFFGLLTQDEQVSGLEAVARHLTPTACSRCRPSCQRWQGPHRRCIRSSYLILGGFRPIRAARATFEDKDSEPSSLVCSMAVAVSSCSDGIPSPSPTTSGSANADAMALEGA